MTRHCERCGFTLPWHFLEWKIRQGFTTYRAICPARLKRVVTKSHEVRNPAYSFLRRYAVSMYITVADETDEYWVPNLSHRLRGGRGFVTWEQDVESNTFSQIEIQDLAKDIWPKRKHSKTGTLR